MNTMHSIDQILFSACPSIQYRIRKELLRQDPHSPEMTVLQNEILQDEAVKRVINSQGSDGWLAWTFHGYDSMESGIRLLCEKGIEITQPVLASALLALEQNTDRLERGLRKVGKILDDLGFGGGETIRASLFAQAGNEESNFVKKQIEQALENFRSVIPIQSLDELYSPYKDKSVFRNDVHWPSIYHLRLLAWTQSWRTQENCKMILESIQNLVRLSPIPDIYVKYKSQWIAPASFCMHHFSPDMNKLSDAEWMQWFHRMELLSRLGVVGQTPELAQQVQFLQSSLSENQGLFIKRLNHQYFQKWGSYTGLALEPDWRSSQRRINDLTFRSLLILHYSNL